MPIDGDEDKPAACDNDENNHDEPKQPVVQRPKLEPSTWTKPNIAIVDVDLVGDRRVILICDCINSMTLLSEILPIS